MDFLRLEASWEQRDLGRGTLADCQHSSVYGVLCFWCPQSTIKSELVTSRHYVRKQHTYHGSSGKVHCLARDWVDMGSISCMLEWNSQLLFSTDVPTSFRLQLLPFCSKLLLEPANDPPCASYPTFSREPGMTSLRIDPVLKRRLSGNIAQRAIPTFLQATSCEHKFYIFAEIKCCRSDPYEVEGYSTFSGARRVPHRLSHNFRERSTSHLSLLPRRKFPGGRSGRDLVSLICHLPRLRTLRMIAR